MSNFAQVRFQTSSSSTSSINHDFRYSKVQYLRTNMFHNKYENQDFGYSKNMPNIKKRIKQSLDEYKNLYKLKHKRNFRKEKNSDFLTGVITLSPSINLKLENEEVTKEELDIYFRDSLLAVVTEMKKDNPYMQLYYAVIHYDEKTPHLHFSTSNHTIECTSIFQNMKKEGLAKYQDICAKPFNSLGYTRGIKKEITNARHKSVREMHATELTELKKEQERYIKKLQEDRDIIKKQKEEIKKADLDLIEKKKKLEDLDLPLINVKDEIKKARELKKEIYNSCEDDIDNLRSKLNNQINFSIESEVSTQTFEEFKDFIEQEEKELNLNKQTSTTLGYK